jgi:hypothetical protein
MFMQKLRILFLCFGLILSSSGFAESKQRREIKLLPATPSVQNEIPNIFRPIGDFFRKLFGKKRQVIYCPPPASVTNLILDKTEVFANCSADGKTCADNMQTIEVSTEAFDPENDVLM